MILADKIIELRKKNGLSQEELAEKMNVSRQSVSKWEGAQSVPDLNKIIALSKIFGVSTDYLLKDEIESPEFSSENEPSSETPLRQVSMEEANEFLSVNKKYSVRLALGCALCVASLIPMLMFGVLSEIADSDIFGGIGVALMLVIIAVAVGIFIVSGSSVEKFKFLETEKIDTAYGVSGMASEKKAHFKPAYTARITTGVILCIVGVAVLIVMAVLGEAAGDTTNNITGKIGIESAEDAESFLGAIGLSSLFLFVSVGVFLMVKASTEMGGYDRLLQEGDFTPDKKQENTDIEKGVNVVMIYWMIVIAIFLGISLGFNTWRWTWIIPAVGGVLTPAVAEIQKAIHRKNR